MEPTRRPMRLPKITKYSVAVTTDGTMVWPQMRMMRPYSRMTMVLKPIQRTTLSRTGGASGSATLLIGTPAPTRAAAGGAAAARGPSPGAPRPSTRRMKISSRRFTLLRMLSTSMPSAESRAKMSLRFCSLDTSTSSV